MKASDYVIVIGRQFGCGARLLGRHLADRLALPYYDRELLGEVARRNGLRSQVFCEADECRPSLLRSMTHVFFGTSTEYFARSPLSPDSLYQAQSQVIKEICSAGPCVIVGRTADYVARDLPNLASIFLHAPLPVRAKRICMRGDADCVQKAMDLARRRDHERENYYNYYTGRHWGHADNYDLCLDSSTISLDDCVQLIIDWLDNRTEPTFEFDNKTTQKHTTP